MAPHELAPGLWRWATRHPDWSAGDWGAEVGSYALTTGDDLLLVDPLLPPEPEAVLAVLDGLAEGRTAHVLITIGYHVRSSAELAERYGAGIHGPRGAGRRLRGAPFTELEPGGTAPAGVQAFAIGKPVRGERPLWLPSHRAVVFGDTVVATPEGELRVWDADPIDEARRRFLREHVAPTLLPLAELGPERVLVTHGAPVLFDGEAALRAAIAADPWYHAG